MTDSKRKRVLSGIQPSGNLTIGNYIGAIRQWVQYQDQFDAYYCVVDLHAITVDYDQTALAAKTREVAALYIACGLDPHRNVIFVQSHLTEHAELAWLLTCNTPLGWLQRMTQFKDKAAKQEEGSVSAGLLTYPILMAADILLYHAEVVPVGEDQKQHLEFTRDLAQRFNHRFGQEVFTIPEPMIPLAGARVMGLDNPTAKMSKSETSQYHAVYLLDEPDIARKKIMRAVTDSGREIRFSDDPERAGVNNLLNIYQALTGQSREAIEAHFATARGYGDLKKEVAEIVIETLRPIQERYRELTSDMGELDNLLRQNADKARAVAQPTLQAVREAMGLLKKS
ncbi:MAG: tryptophan--tRNA ligase [Phototrophicales bacterium]|nr:MAG: tryptophan--tRNA ligase [Phototrophicales bacterium]